MVFLYIFAIIYLILVLIQLCRGIYSRFDHSSWNESAQPSQDATITDVTPEKVKYSKNNAKFKTTVTFSDGFRFVTHRTNKVQHLMSYDISIDINEITTLAIEAHQKAVEKELKK